MLDLSVNVSNGLVITIDWLEFTITLIDSVSEVLRLFGYDISDFSDMKSGFHGYRSGIILDTSGLKVFFDGSNDDMGIHVVVSSSALSSFCSAFCDARSLDTPFGMGFEHKLEVTSSLFAEVFHCINENGHITRLDVAIDDKGCQFYSPADVHACSKRQEISTKFRSVTYTEGYSLANPSESGATLYLGASSGEIRIRIYDKGYEQYSKGYLKSPIPWTRWEFQLRREHAAAFSKNIIDGIEISQAALGLFNDYIRLIIRDDSNTSRCSSQEKWVEFLNGVASCPLNLPVKEKTIESTEAYLGTQAATSLVTVLLAHGGDISFLEDLLKDGLRRVTPSQYKRIRLYHMQHGMTRDESNQYLHEVLGYEYE